MAPSVVRLSGIVWSFRGIRRAPGAEKFGISHYNSAMTEPATTPELPKAAGPAHLTDVLRRAGVLGNGRVAGVTVESSTPTIMSHIYRLQLANDGAPNGAPASLILKTAPVGRPPVPWKPGRQEVAFYRDIASASPPGLVPRCFDAHWDDASEAWHLLLEDLTDTHAISQPWPLPPTLAECEAIVRTRARFHAAWWDDPRLGVSVGQWYDPASDAQSAQGLAAQVQRFAEAIGDRFSSGRREFYARLVEQVPRLGARYRSHRHMTIVHGDAHVWNNLLPRNGDPDGIRLFDWDAWRLDTGSDDLAYMMALHWHPDLRRQRERHLLDVYHAELMARGVQGYDRRALDDDYRLSTLWASTIPIWQHAGGIPPVIWWHHLDRIHLAMDDLGCRELLG